jgi:hypothetical protein
MMTTDLTMVIDPTPTATRLLLTQGSQEVLKARLGPASRTHRWAAPMLLEALAHWYQRPVRAVLCAGANRTSSDLDLWEGLGFGACTALYEVEVLDLREPRRARLSAPRLGDFRDLRRARGEVAW